MTNLFIKHFQVPECAQPYIHMILSTAEKQILDLYGPTDSFNIYDIAETFRLSQAEADELLTKSYQRGVLSMLTASRYHIADFYNRLGIFCQYESNLWHRIPKAARDIIGDWYLQSFIHRNQPLWETGQRTDRVAPLAEALDFLSQHKGPIYVATCDCRSIFEHCDHSRETCISFSDNYNSPAHRGHAREISLPKALELVKECDKEGLIHTLEGDHGMCNCCGDCCFEYRSAQLCGIVGTWPVTHTIASYEPGNCISCGLCTRRCPMNAFTKKGKDITFDPSSCIGCGLCVNACPRHTITLSQR